MVVHKCSSTLHVVVFDDLDNTATSECTIKGKGSTTVSKYMYVFVVVVVLVFYDPSTHFRLFWARSVSLSTLFLSKPSRQFIST